MYVIIGATGNTGSVAADALLAKGEAVRVVGRSAERLERFTRQGAEAFVADAKDPAALTRAFTGARAVYLLIPPDPTAQDYRADQETVSDALAAAIDKAGVTHAVVLSSLGAEHASGTGPIAGLHSLEQKLNANSRLNALYIRAAYFMENLLMSIAPLQKMGIFGGSIKGELKIPMIATRDIGAYAAEALRALDFTGKETRDLLGQRDLSHNEAGGILGKAIGKPSLSYSHFPGMLVKMAMAQMGVPGKSADLILEMFEAINKGVVAPREPRTAQNTTSTAIETFATEEFAPRFLGKAVSA
jgi:uncharacterized protein YbjT (DUF2867 family)